MLNKVHTSLLPANCLIIFALFAAAQPAFAVEVATPQNKHEKRWLVNHNQIITGPFTTAEAYEQIKHGRIQSDTLMVEVGGTTWVPADSIFQFALPPLPSRTAPPVKTDTPPPARSTGFWISGGVLLGIGLLYTTTMVRLRDSLELNSEELEIYVILGVFVSVTGVAMLIAGATRHSEYKKWQRSHTALSGINIVATPSFKGMLWQLSF